MKTRTIPQRLTSQTYQLQAIFCQVRKEGKWRLYRVCSMSEEGFPAQRPIPDQSKLVKNATTPLDLQLQPNRVYSSCGFVHNLFLPIIILNYLLCPSDPGRFSLSAASIFARLTIPTPATAAANHRAPGSALAEAATFYKTTSRITLIFKSCNTSTALIQDWILEIKKDGRSKLRRGATKTPSLLQRKPLVLQNHRRPSPARLPQITRGIQSYPTFRSRLSYFQDGMKSPSLHSTPTPPPF